MTSCETATALLDQAEDNLVSAKNWVYFGLAVATFIGTVSIFARCFYRRSKFRRQGGTMDIKKSGKENGKYLALFYKHNSISVILIAVAVYLFDFHIKYFTYALVSFLFLYVILIIGYNLSKKK